MATAAAVLAVPATAEANYSHIVEPGESLTSIASTDGLSLSALAAANGLSARSELVVGQIVEIPPLTASTSYRSRTRTYVSAASSDTSNAASGSYTAGGSYVVRRGDTLSAIAIREGTTIDHLAALNGLNPNHYLIAGTTLKLSGVTSSSAATTDYVSAATSSSTGSYVVQPGDSLSAIAARAGTSLTELAALNGINPDHLLIVGTVLTLPSGGAGVASTSTSGPATGAGNQQITGATSEGPYPTDETVSSSEIGSAAAADGLDPSLAEAIGWQESGFNNDLVSSTGAVGVMQIEPATWSWINQVLTPGAPLSPSSAYDNVRGGVLLLHNLVSQTGSDAMAAAAYYQGLASVREHGLFSDTQQYVNDVTALQGRF